MNDFQYMMFHSKMETEKTTIQKEFLDFRNMIELNEQLFDQIIASQLHSYKEKMKETREAERITVTKARIKYNEIFAKSKGDEEERHSWARHASGLENIDYDSQIQEEAATDLAQKHLDSIRKSMMVTVFSLIESSLYSIGEMAHREFKTKLKISHLNSKNYIKAAFDYLDLVIELNQDHYINYYEKLSDYRTLRNCFVHNNAILTVKEKDNLKSIFNDSVDVTDKSNGLVQLKISKEAIVKDLFTHAKLIMENIHWAFEERLQFKPIEERCMLWFCILDEEIELSDFKAVKKSPNKVEIEFLFSSKTEKIKNMKCHVEVSSRQTRAMLLKNHTNSEVIDKFLMFTRKQSGVLFKGVFDLVFLTKPSIRVAVNISQ